MNDPQSTDQKLCTHEWVRAGERESSLWLCLQCGATTEKHPLPADYKRSLVERLRSRAWEDRQHRKLRAEAADEIERLRTAIDQVHNARLVWAMVCECGCQACDDLYEALKLKESAADVGAEG